MSMLTLWCVCIYKSTQYSQFDIHWHTHMFSTLWHRHTHFIHYSPPPLWHYNTLYPCTHYVHTVTCRLFMHRLCSHYSVHTVLTLWHTDAHDKPTLTRKGSHTMTWIIHYTHCHIKNIWKFTQWHDSTGTNTNVISITTQKTVHVVLQSNLTCRNGPTITIATKDKQKYTSKSTLNCRVYLTTNISQRWKAIRWIRHRHVQLHVHWLA